MDTLQTDIEVFSNLSRTSADTVPHITPILEHALTCFFAVLQAELTSANILFPSAMCVKVQSL